ncbi:MAG: InlB B-repeat-containing protein [Bifidobacterium adolescentis]|nr:InlB B-repeat-containing protein [Bifidobacterium adolescentis]
MGFLTRLLAGLLAASTLGTGLAGTTNAVDVTGAAGNTKSVVKLTADGGNETSEDTADNPDDDSTDADSTTDAGAQSDAGQQAEIQSSTSQDKATAKSSLPDHIVNGSFDYPACPDGKNSCDVDPTTGWGGFYVDYGRKFMPIPDWNRSKFGWDSSQEGLRPDQQPNSHQKLQHCVQIGNKPNNNGQKMNRFAEIIAETPDEYIYQDIATTPGVMYRWSLKHASEDASHVDSMQVTIGSPGKETAQDATRTTSNGRGDRTGVTSKTIATKGGQAEWETYTGVYIATSTVTRFTFKSAQGRDSTRGNFIDDVMFTKAYKLTYDKNSADASGQVPSNQRGKENTTQPAKNKTAGTVRTVADKTASGLTVHDLKNGEIAPVQYGDFKFSTVNGFSADQVTNVNGFTVKTNWDPCEENQAYASVLTTMYQPNGNGANLILHHVGQWRDSSGTQRWLNARITVNGQNLGTLVYIPSIRKFLASYGKWDLHPSSRPYMDVTVDFLLDDGSTPQGLRGVTGFTDLDGGTSGYNEGVELVSGFDGAYVRSDAHLTRFGTNGWAGITDENKHDADAHGMKHYVGATFTGSSFRARWSVALGQARQSGFQPVDSTIAYRLTYNKNAQDATGSIPSDTAANTTQPAKSETDGKVSDLVQRTTTHEDGSVTVKTIDTSTDVVSGCQVYYPAGQRITLATMAKDDDCWDSSMLSRPGHTQLGWNQDRNATQAQAQVTMVEGGMTVYAVWVGNPVLTYDTNKPSTWSGQMPSTPASVSVTYNTAATDGSGWQSGDTTKLRGYRFLGWYTTPQDNAGLYDWTRPLTGSVTVYAHWQRLQANVVYNANGGTGSHPNTTGWQYSDVTIPGDTSKSFKRDKYVFKGWGTKPGKADVVYKDGSKVALQDKDITLYAQWQEVHENFVETGGIGLPIAIAGGVLLLMFGIGSTVMLTRRMNGHGMPDDE